MLNVDLGLGNGLAVPENLAGGGPGEPRQHAQQGRLTRARWAQQGDDFSLHNGQVGGRDHLDPVFAGLGVVLLDLLGANDRFSHRQTSNEEIGGQVNLICRTEADNG